MDTPTIAKYYRENDPLKRKALLEQSLEQGEEPDENKIRQELWDLRYQKTSEDGRGIYADGYLALWMILEFNRGSDKKLFGGRGARREILQQLEKLKFREIRAKSPLHEELLYRECCHMVRLYIELSMKDKNYNSVFLGIIAMSEESARNKIRRDILETGVSLPESLGMEELAPVSRAAREVYDLYFPGE